jgi:hypothetical protein
MPFRRARQVGSLTGHQVEFSRLQSSVLLK